MTIHRVIPQDVYHAEGRRLVGECITFIPEDDPWWIMNRIAALGGSGSHVTFKPGEYVFNSTIYVRGDDIVIEAEQGAHITGHSSGPVFRLHGDCIRLYYLSIFRDSAGTCSPIQVYGDDALIEHCSIRAKFAGGQNLFVYVVGQDCIVTDCDFEVVEE